MIKNYFNFKKMNQNYLLTNDTGRFLFLTNQEFKEFVSDNIVINSKLFRKLEENYFVSDRNQQIFISETAKEVRRAKKPLFQGTQLHIFVLTRNCNMNCVYCQASIKNATSDEGKMSFNIAEKAIDLALQSPSRNLTFEFQGGEPLMNFQTLQHIVKYTKYKNQEYNKEIEFNVVTNLTMITTEMIDFLIDNDINICTSIDGHDQVHNVNRPMKGKPSLNIIKDNIVKINDMYKKREKNAETQAIQTTTRISLDYPKEIIDEYMKLGFNGLFIRPLTPLGFSIKNWNKIGYTSEEFCRFYEKCIDYIIELSRQGKDIREFHATIFLKKILNNDGINYMELRSPCGGAIGQIAYNYDGEIYTCDEARMIAETGDKSFKIGNVNESTYNDLIDNPITKSVCVSSCLEILPECSECVYQPYCGTCPVYNYIEQRSIFGKMPLSYKCKIYKGILNLLFKKLHDEDEGIIEIFYRWIN